MSQIADNEDQIYNSEEGSIAQSHQHARVQLPGIFDIFTGALPIERSGYRILTLALFTMRTYIIIDTKL